METLPAFFVILAGIMKVVILALGAFVLLLIINAFLGGNPIG